MENIPFIEKSRRFRTPSIGESYVTAVLKRLMETGNGLSMDFGFFKPLGQKGKEGASSVVRS